MAIDEEILASYFNRTGKDPLFSKRSLEEGLGTPRTPRNNDETPFAWGTPTWMNASLAAFRGESPP